MEFFQPTFSIAILNFTTQNQNQNENLILSRCDLTDFSCCNLALNFEIILCCRNLTIFFVEGFQSYVNGRFSAGNGNNELEGLIYYSSVFCCQRLRETLILDIALDFVYKIISAGTKI